jgi:prolactin regulatory element-binding protein
MERPTDLTVCIGLRYQPLLKILHAHSFAITALAFNPSGNLLASAGADNTVRLIVIPASFGSCKSPGAWLD